jgi:hypothetical protein
VAEDLGPGGLLGERAAGVDSEKKGEKKRVVSDWLIHSIKKKRHPPLGFPLGSPFLRLQLFDG